MSDDRQGEKTGQLPHPRDSRRGQESPLSLSLSQFPLVNRHQPGREGGHFDRKQVTNTTACGGSREEEETETGWRLLWTR